MARNATGPRSRSRYTDEKIARGAAAQKGLATTRQLVAAGLSHDAIRKREGRTLHRVFHGVYTVGHPALPPGARELAAVLACGSSERSGALVSHRSAAVLWKLLRDRPGPVEITVARRRRSRPGIRVHYRPVAARDRARADGVPVTSVGRTLTDLAAVVSAVELDRAVNEALARMLTTHPELDARLRAALGKPGAPMLRAVLGTAPAGHTRSRGERELLSLLRSAGLAPDGLNERVLGARVDVLFRAAKLVVELDEHATHATRERFEADHRRDLRLRRSGWQVLRVTSRQVLESPHEVVALIRAELAHSS